VGHEGARTSRLTLRGPRAVDGTVTRIREEWGVDELVVATGGLAELIGPHCRTVQQIEPFLTLYGLEFAREHLAGAA
jgi:type III pantothenate kinase